MSLKLPSFLFLLGIETKMPREAAVMRQNGIGTEPLAEMMCDPLSEPPRVDEDQRRAIFAREFGETVVNLAPHLVARDWAEFVFWNLNR